MLCEKCKIREANIQYTEVMNGVKTEHHFCAQCAKEMDFGPYSALFDGDYPLGKLLSGLLGIEDTSRIPDKFHQIVCPTCNTTYDNFIKGSRFGCKDCYSIFGPLMEDSIKQLQGNVVHTGKKPKYQQIACADKQIPSLDSLEAEKEHAGKEAAAAGVEGISEEEQDLLILEEKLKDALRLEDYETAAVCRDKIRDLKKGTEANA